MFALRPLGGFRPGGRLVAALVAAPLLLAGCGTSEAATTAQGASGHSVHGTSTAPGEAMAGTTRDGHGAQAHGAAAGSTPPDTALMVCSEDISSKVAQILKLAGPPQTTDTWADPVYTCTYSLPTGQMVLTVAVAPDDATAGRDFDALPGKRPGSAPLIGLGERALGTPDGTVTVLKDNQILTVDTTRLPEVFGPLDQRRTDLAFEVASDVLGCWTGDEHG